MTSTVNVSQVMLNKWAPRQHNELYSWHMPHQGKRYFHTCIPRKRWSICTAINLRRTLLLTDNEAILHKSDCRDMSCIMWKGHLGIFQVWTLNYCTRSANIWIFSSLSYTSFRSSTYIVYAINEGSRQTAQLHIYLNRLCLHIHLDSPIAFSGSSMCELL